MARVQKVDHGVSSRLDEFEQRIFVLKIEYEKFFSGLTTVEPIRERDELRRILRDLLQIPQNNARVRFRLQQLRSRWATQELYWTRNNYQIERGTHPKQRYRADVKERARMEAELERQKANAELTRDASGSPMATLLPADASLPPQRLPPPAPKPGRIDREEAGYRAVYDAYMEARGRTGQSTDADYKAVRDTLKKQVEALKERTQCSSVKFKVVVEDGKAKVKAIPVKPG